MEYPLTASQMVFYPKGLPGEETMWNQGIAPIFRRKYSYDQLNHAFNRLIESHEELRLQICQQDGRPTAYIAEFQPVQYPLFSFSSREEVIQNAYAFMNQPIPISGPLFRCAIFQTESSSGLLLASHHMIIDGFSGHILNSFINDCLRGESPDLELIQPYSEHFRQTQDYLLSPRYAQAKEYWRKRLSEPFPVSPFLSVSSVMSRAAEIVLDFPDELFDRIVGFCHNQRVTVTAFFSAVIGTYIQREFHCSNFIMGVPVLNRDTPCEMHTAGLYMNILPLTVDVSAESFLACAKKIDAGKMRLLRHRKFTQFDIQQVIEELGLPPAKLFDIVFNYQAFPENEDYEFAIQHGNTLSTTMEIHFNTMGPKPISCE